MKRQPNWTNAEMVKLLPWTFVRLPREQRQLLALRLGRSQSAVNVKLWQMRRSGGIKVPTNEVLTRAQKQALQRSIKATQPRTIEAQTKLGRDFGVSARTVREYARHMRESGSAAEQKVAPCLSRRCLSCAAPFVAVSRFLRLCAACRTGSLAAA